MASTDQMFDQVRAGLAELKAHGVMPNVLILHPEITQEEADALAAAIAALNAKSFTDRWHAFNARALREERRLERAALALFRAERADVADRLVSAVPSLKAPADPHPSVANPYIEAALLKIAADYAPGGDYHTAWLERYRRLIARTFTIGSSGVRIGLSFTLANPRAQAAIQRRVTKLTGQVTETTVQRVRDVVAESMREGVGVTEIAKRIRTDAFGESVTLTRARTIARTETVGSMNEGRYTAATTSGVMQAKRWLSQQDGRVRPSHEDAASEGWLGIDDRFGNGLLYPHEPGAPADEVIQCRCSVLFSDLPPAEANARRP